MPQNTVTLLGGDGGTGKSLLALQLAVAVAADAPWLGRKVSAGSAIYMSAEDETDELHRRLSDILRCSAEPRTTTPRVSRCARWRARTCSWAADIPASLALTTSQLFRELEQRARDDGPALIVIDTLADVYPANENDRAKVRQFVGILRGLAIRQQCAVILLAHPSLSGPRVRVGHVPGSTAWNNSVRSRLYLERILSDKVEVDPKSAA